MLGFFSLAPAVIAWLLWFSEDRRKMSSLRSGVFLVGQVGVVGSLGVLFYLADYIRSDPGFGNIVNAVDRWIFPGFWMAFIASGLCLAGRGWSRVWGVFSGVLD